LHTQLFYGSVGEMALIHY